MQLFAHSWLVSGIGHKIKSVNNPDLRVELVKEYVQKHFPSHSLLDYALAVEKVTTSKKDTESILISRVMLLILSLCSSFSTLTVASPSVSLICCAIAALSPLRKPMSILKFVFCLHSKHDS